MYHKRVFYASTALHLRDISYFILICLDACYQVLIRGSCGTSFANQRYYYDQNTGSCKLFVFFGCGGNQNNFLTRFDCENTCVAKPGKDFVTQISLTMN